nr:uncharacterized protein LOC123281751 isoform X3 [Equus asinus]XP_044617484.1 uncharacterized protein LOC123281751 isoform X3 [Equus asinus]XP_044617485.1 uncharacterized protein LOC123281751 isoform X3 [Equus asinus]
MSLPRRGWGTGHSGTHSEESFSSLDPVSQVQGSRRLPVSPFPETSFSSHFPSERFPLWAFHTKNTAPLGSKDSACSPPSCRGHRGLPEPTGGGGCPSAPSRLICGQGKLPRLGLLRSLPSLGTVRTILPPTPFLLAVRTPISPRHSSSRLWSTLRAATRSCAGLVAGRIANFWSFPRVSGALLRSETRIRDHCTAPGLQVPVCVSPEAVLRPLEQRSLGFHPASLSGTACPPGLRMSDPGSSALPACSLASNGTDDFASGMLTFSSRSPQFVWGENSYGETEEREPLPLQCSLTFLR